MKQEYRPCPICHGNHPESCEVCKGRGCFPYPWIKPEDKLIRKRWTVSDTKIILDAISGKEAYQRYVSVYGMTERSYSSVYRHWQYSQIKHNIRPRWTESEINILKHSSDIYMAVIRHHMYADVMRTDRAIKAKYYEGKFSSICQVV